MYEPEHFREDRPDILHAFIRRHPLGALVSAGEQGLTADHIPMQLETAGAAGAMLRGHIARANPLWRNLVAPVGVLVIFGGANRYITPSWYATKRETGAVVPTWNYSVVHAHGRLRFVEDATWLHGLVSALTDEHEAQRPRPWKVTDAPQDYIARMLRAIVGFEIEVERLTGKFKASQNRSDSDRDGVGHGLEASGMTGEDAHELLRSPRR